MSSHLTLTTPGLRALLGTVGVFVIVLVLASTPPPNHGARPPTKPTARRSHNLGRSLVAATSWLILCAWRSLADALRSQFHRHGRHKSFNDRTRPMPAPTNGSLGESTPLLGAPRDSDPKWKTYSKNVWSMVWGTLSSNYVNVLLVFVPLGIIAGKLHWSPTAVFVLNFIAIMPLAALLSFATEELSAKLGQTLGGLCNATFGNAVELIVSICACFPKTLDTSMTVLIRAIPGPRSISGAVWKPSARISILTRTGLDRCAQCRTNPCCPSQHARQYPIQYASCKCALCQSLFFWLSGSAGCTKTFA